MFILPDQPIDVHAAQCSFAELPNAERSEHYHWSAFESVCWAWGRAARCYAAETRVRNGVTACGTKPRGKEDNS